MTAEERLAAMQIDQPGEQVDEVAGGEPERVQAAPAPEPSSATR
jgi:hypothetical protein